MRILLVSQYFWPEHFRINDLAEGLVKRGHEITVLTGCPNYPGGRIFKGYGFFNQAEVWCGVKILRVPLIPRGSGSSLRLAMNYVSFMVSATLLGPPLCRGSFDVVLVCQLSPVTVGIPAALLKRLKGIPMVFWVLDLWPESLAAAGGLRSKWIYNGVDGLVKFIYRHCDRILCSSKGFFSSIQSRGVETSRISHFPNWVEPIEGSAMSLPVKLPAGFRVLFAGNVGMSQDFETVLAAANLLRDVSTIQWIILGGGRQLAWVQAQVKARGLTHCFHLLGSYPPETMPAFFHEADALLVTLRRDPAFAHTVPGKVTSYMSCGRPILAALDGEGSALIQEAKAGFSVPSGDFHGLAKIVMQMSQLPAEERIRMGRSAKEYCDAHFNRDRLFTELEAILASLIKSQVTSR